MLTLTDSEVKTFDAQLGSTLEWAKARSAEAEQLALDCTRLLSCTEDRLGQIQSQGFFKRCWYKLSGKNGEIERANTSDLIHMQKISLRYINLLQERQLMMAHSLLTLKNNLVTLAIKEEETRDLLAMLAENTMRRFQELGNRVDQLEISSNLQGWLLTLEDREYEQIYPTPCLRMFRVVNDFYSYKNDNWNYHDILFMRKALRSIGLNPKQSLSVKTFIENLVDEIKLQGFDSYSDLVMACVHGQSKDFGCFALANISSPVFTTIHALHAQYLEKLDVIDELSEELLISREAALKRILSRYVSKLNVDLNSCLPLSDVAVEMLSGLRLSRQLIEINRGAENNYGKFDDVLHGSQPHDHDVHIGDAKGGGDVNNRDFAKVCSSDAVMDEENIFFLNSRSCINQMKLDRLTWVLRKISCEENDLSLYSRSPWNVYNVFGFQDRYICVLERHGSEFVYFSTSDFVDFVKLNIDPGLYCVECNGKIFAFEGGYYRATSAYCSNDFSSWDKIDIDFKYGNDGVKPTDVFFVNGVWVVVVSYKSLYSRTRSGLFFNTEEQRDFSTIVVHVSADLKEWKTSILEKQFPKLDVRSVLVVGDSIVLFGKVDLDDQFVFARSTNGLEWEKISWPEIGHDVDRVRSFNNTLHLFDLGKLSKTTDFLQFESLTVPSSEWSPFRPPCWGVCKDSNVGMSQDLCVFKDKNNLIFTSDFVSFYKTKIPPSVLPDVFRNFLIFVLDKYVVLGDGKEFIVLDV